MVLHVKTSPERALGSGSVWDSLQMFNMETFPYDVSANALDELWGDSDLDQVFKYFTFSFSIYNDKCILFYLNFRLRSF